MNNTQYKATKNKHNFINCPWLLSAHLRKKKTKSSLKTIDLMVCQQEID
jgi:hypothetical protein